MSNDSCRVITVPSALKQPLSISLVARPQPGPGEVLIKVAAAGVNRADVKQRDGTYAALPEGASQVLGLEVSGVIASCGEGVKAFAPGDRVCALVSSGGYADYCVAPALQCLPMPANLSFVEAAALPQAYATAWLALIDQAAVQAGETVLVHGGASSVGLASIQLLIAIGCKVFVTAGSLGKNAVCEELGAIGINYNIENFGERIPQLTGGDGVDVVLDMIGGPYAERNVAILKTGGRLVYVAGDGGAQATFTLREIMRKRLKITGVMLQSRTQAEKHEILHAVKSFVWPLLDAGTVRQIIGQVFALDQAELAHRCLSEGAAIGKVVLSVDETL